MRRKKQWGVLLIAVVSSAVAYLQHNRGKTIVESHQSYQSADFKVKPTSHDDDYRQALKILWTKVYQQGGKTLYCSAHFSTKNHKERKKTTNAEHIFPMSWVAKALHCGTRKKCQKNSAKFREIESDLYNIYPAIINVNKARSNFRFGEVLGEKRHFGHCDFEVNEYKRIAEPAPAIRGKIARAMLYMVYKYDLPLHKKNKALMLKWDKEVAPDQEEKRRAKVIEREQGRENPFITKYPFTGKSY